MKIKSIFIENYKVLKDFKIDFYDNDGKINPITVICGINGSGKTTLLEFIYDKIRLDPSITDKSKITIEDNGLFSKTTNNEITFTRDFPGTLDHDTYTKNQKNLLYYKINSDNNYTAKTQIINFIDELIYEKDYKSSKAYDELRSILSEILKNLNLEVEFNHLDKKKIIYFKNKQSDKIKLEELSGGEKEIITKFFPLYISRVKDKVILIDEPESSLHPNWQSEIIYLYQEIAVKNNNQIIITTHSPHIVSAVKREHLKILKKEDGVIKAIDSSSNPYGKKIDEILLDIFRVKGLRTPAVEKKIQKLTTLLNKNEQKTNEFGELLSELETDIGKFDSDLALIRMEVKRKEKEK